MRPVELEADDIGAVGLDEIVAANGAAWLAVERGEVDRRLGVEHDPQHVGAGKNRGGGRTLERKRQFQVGALMRQLDGDLVRIGLRLWRLCLDRRWRRIVWRRSPAELDLLAEQRLPPERLALVRPSARVVLGGGDGAVATFAAGTGWTSCATGGGGADCALGCGAAGAGATGVATAAGAACGAGAAAARCGLRRLRRRRIVAGASIFGAAGFRRGGIGVAGFARGQSRFYCGRRTRRPAAQPRQAGSAGSRCQHWPD